MPVHKSTAIADLWLGSFLVALCAVALWESRDIPPGTFEPLGSAPAPQAVALLVMALTLAVMWRAWRALHRGTAQRVRDVVVPRWADAALVSALTIVYVAGLHLRVGRFDVLTSIYLFVVIGLLLRFERKRLPAVAAVAVTVGFGCQYAFTRIFVVDLPGAF